ncbi:cell cycle control protein 50C-like isoform X2 [Hyperolius riggenbachi]|uniref:cell cycle control protein 50C-like isoform X2 n=1 Tax=Hyperolius riggenbachi TaxID=752182 RepID=UPI0035A399FA
MGKKAKTKEDLPVSKCPDNTAFKQQRLPASRPLLTADSVISTFFIIGLFCLAVGVSWIVATTNVKEIWVTYSEHCQECTKLRENTSNSEKPCSCSVSFNVNDKLQSIQKQSYCAPFSTYKNGTPMAPCGAIANSMFNDTISLFYNPNPTISIPVPLLNTGNTWWSDKNVKFSNPKPKDNLVQAFAGSARPPYWQKPAYELDPQDPNNNGYINDDFINWMRVAALPSFRKLYRRLYRVQPFDDGLPAGNYTYEIQYNFPVSKFGGKKHIILTTTAWCGGKNMFLGIAYAVTGGAIIVTAIIMLAIHLKKREKKKKKNPFSKR